MLPILLSAVGTFLIWLLASAAAFGCLSGVVGWQISRLVPPGQYMLPRHIIVALAIFKGVVIGLVSGLHVGGAAATLAAGDAVATGRTHVIWRPWVGVNTADVAGPVLAPVQEAVAGFGAAFRGEWSEIRVHGVLSWLGEDVLLGAFAAPANATRIVGQAFVRRVQSSPRGAVLSGNATAMFATAWHESRPALAMVATRSIAMTAILTLLHLAVLALLGLCLVWLARRELRTVAAKA